MRRGARPFSAALDISEGEKELPELKKKSLLELFQKCLELPNALTLMQCVGLYLFECGAFVVCFFELSNAFCNLLLKGSLTNQAQGQV